MDGWVAAGTLASVVAAVGVVWERTVWWANRPRSRLEIAFDRKEVDTSQKGFHKFHGTAMNWGTEPIESFGVHGVSCTLAPVHMIEPRIPNEIPKGKSVSFTATVEDSRVEEAWIFAVWFSPSAPRHARSAWFAVKPNGELAAVRERQLARNWIQRLAAWTCLERWVSPTTIPFGKLGMDRPRSARAVPSGVMSGRRPKQARPWARLGARLFRIQPEAAADAALMNAVISEFDG